MFVTNTSRYENAYSGGFAELKHWYLYSFVVLWFDSSELSKTVPPTQENIKKQLTCLALQSSFGAYETCAAYPGKQVVEVTK